MRDIFRQMRKLRRRILEESLLGAADEVWLKNISKNGGMRFQKRSIKRGKVMTFEDVTQGLINKLLNLGKKLKTTQIIVGGFALIILLGAGLLKLPFATNPGLKTTFLDAFFTSTSAVCVTGLVVVNTYQHWSPFGKVIIALLIQVGGLGFMTLVTTVLIFLGKKITLKERLVIQESLNQSDITGMVRLVKNVVIGTLAIEAITAIFLALRFWMEPDIGFVRAVFMGAFHAVSAFCNAGFDIVGTNSLMGYVGDPIVNVVIMALIIVGGIGFAVWMDLLKVFKLRHDKRFTLRAAWQKLNLHSKLVLQITFILIVSGFVFFFLAEYSNPKTLGPLNIGQKFWAALFQSVSPRTAGFNTIDQSAMHYGSIFFTIVLMYIGGSPGGTAGGIKTVTLSVIIISVLSVIKGKTEIVAHNKSVPLNLLQRSLAVSLMNLTLIIVATTVLTLTEHRMGIAYNFIDLLFEVTSAVGTVGLTLGITPYLSVLGKLVICVCMFIGRLGPVSVAVALSLRLAAGSYQIHYPEEKVLIG